MKNKLTSGVIELVENCDKLNNFTLIKAAIDLNIEESLITVYLPEKIESIIDFHIESILQNIDNISTNDITGFSGKLIFMIKNLYRELNQTPRFLREMLKYQLQHPAKSIPRLSKLCDNLIKTANDRSIDFSFYTKRAKLLQILLLTIIDILRNKSPEDIEHLIEYRINQAKNSKIKNVINFWKSKIS
jgi:rpsU-divergently transcribed protein